MSSLYYCHDALKTGQDAITYHPSFGSVFNGVLNYKNVNESKPQVTLEKAAETDITSLEQSRCLAEFHSNVESMLYRVCGSAVV